MPLAGVEAHGVTVSPDGHAQGQARAGGADCMRQQHMHPLDHGGIVFRQVGSDSIFGNLIPKAV